MTGEATNQLPLADLHAAAGARFGVFAGWNMPLTYPIGVMKEHLHTREHVGLFDISHMKLFLVTGLGAADLINRACPLEARALDIRQAKYTFFLTETAGMIDDLIITRLDDERFMVVANAGNAANDETHLRTLAKGFDAMIEPLDRVFIAIQGPEAADSLDKAGIVTDELFFMQGFEPRADWFMSRSGYTGEDGFEIGLPEADARELLAKLLTDKRVMWIGLAARDSLRLEAGLCLHGNDITNDNDPVSAGLMWAIPKGLCADGSFIGRAALAKILAEGAAQKRVGLKPDGRQLVRSGAELFDVDGNSVGRVASGGFGPSVGCPVAMGYVSAALAKVNTRLFAEVRGTKVPVDVHALPFTQHRHRTPPKRMISMTKTYFTEDHEWIRVESDIVTVGITDYAQEQLGDLVFVDLPEVGRKLSKGDVAVVVESVKAASDVYAPVDGDITEANCALSGNPALINNSATNEGWLWKMTLTNPAQLDGLMDEADYKANFC